MWNKPDYCWYFLDAYDLNPWKSFDEVTDACQRPPTLCGIQQSVGASAATGASVRGFLASRWKTTS